MKNRLPLLLICLSSLTSPLLAEKKKVAFDATPVAGYRQDNLKWTTSNGNSLKWKNLQFIDYGIKTETTLIDRYKIKLDIEFANVLSGKMSDSGYLARPGSMNPFTNNINAKGSAFRPNIAFGFNMKPKKSVDLIPQIGYEYDRLKLSGKRTTGNPLTSLTNTIQWHGPWIGLDSKMRLSQRFSLSAAAIANLAFYRGSGNWQFQGDATSNTLKQNGTGMGLTGQVGAKYMVVKSVSVGAEADIHWNRIRSGHDTRHFANGTTSKNKLKANWTSFAGRLTLTKSF